MTTSIGRTTKARVAVAALCGVMVAGAGGVAFADSSTPVPVTAAAATDSAAAGASGHGMATVTAARPVVGVWKSPTCGCCEGRVTYLEDEGFEVVAHDTDNVDAVKLKLELVDPRLKSCHTAKIAGYVVEGHVPVSDIERPLAERPDVVGISAPGMPMMSSGLGGIEPTDYDVVSFAADGTIGIFASH